MESLIETKLGEHVLPKEVQAAFATALKKAQLKV
jgi:hypothetical protein